MKATVSPAYVKERIQLGKVLPLDTPYRMTISPSQICNLKCFFCTHSVEKSKVLETGFKYKNMEYELFVKLVEQLKCFPKKIKLIVFSGMGEPLLNKKLPDMIRYLKQNNVVDRVEVYSNATLLNHNIVHELVDSGLDSFRISLEGLTEKKYKEVSQYNINFDDFIDNIQYFYNHRGKCEIYIKIIDALLEKGEETTFYNTFGNISDKIYIEHLSDCQPLTNDCNGIVDPGKTMYNEQAKICKVCPLLFYSLYADVECNIYPCVTLGLPLKFSIANINHVGVKDIWNGDKIKQLRILHLKGKKDTIPVCKECGNMICMYHKEDDIDSYSNSIIQKLNESNL
ncbi:radical SAM protein [Clostridium tyrobutyricum]|uniref:Radical SAM core domain-containing protein n=1 Tax=Clostridium tyrobutyricum DIVETGP TaxID=1408889 RepID=W6NHX1_CLOTY|nr:radical SAM/SPASM domain-containing protein [Clostridium tyrobutyricum]AND85384.1 radical SAM domain protein [Clostridium tyrobutyricum]ANP69932.1 hypothetical protein BA182_09645 [Clostridium tyrobutyricum]MBV4433986.1 radical SAM protein [Clostridium tyrobutyricum]QNB65706.1 radical SAM protein [Clostridium tyrobutyricum]CDL91657.1 hypothetical protein CTDIVETGP_1727 [Clostridium tyrobutyricum DIVETGP]